MSIPRVLLAPTHRSGLANGLAAAVAEILAGQGERVRYHHLGPMSPMCAWDRWEGASFLDPDLYDEVALLSLYEVATRSASLSLLSCTRGLLDNAAGAQWVPADVARLLDCPVVPVLDCRGWGTGIRALLGGLKAQLAGLNLGGVVFTGLEDKDHFDKLRSVASAEGVPTLGALFTGGGLSWDVSAPGPWGLPLSTALLESVERQVDIPKLQMVAGQRGFLSSPSWLINRGAAGPLVLVAAGKGFTLWSRDSIEVLRAAGAQVRRLDLVEDNCLPREACGLVLAGTPWPGGLADVAVNESLCRDLQRRIGEGMPTLAMGGGMLVLLTRVHDSLGRTAALADVLPAESEILWDLEEPTYVRVTAERDNLLLSRGDSVLGWMTAEIEIQPSGQMWNFPFTVQGTVSPDGRQADGVATPSLVCTRAFVHLAAKPDLAERFVRNCAAYAAQRNREEPRQGTAPAGEEGAG